MNLFVAMLRKRVIEQEEADDARIAALRKRLREERGEEKPPPSFLLRFRGRRTEVIP